MGNVQLTISSNLEEVIAKINQLDKSVENLNKDITESGKASKQSYDTATREADQFNQAQVRNQQTASKSMQMFAKFGGLIAGAFSVAAVVAWGKAIVQSTGRGEDAVEEFKTGVQSMGVALNRAIAAGDFTNIIGGLRNAFKEGKLFAQVLDEIRARQAGLAGLSEDIATQIAQQRIIMMDNARSQEERRAAIEEIIRLEKVQRDEYVKASDEAIAKTLRYTAIQLNAAETDQNIIETRKQLILDIAEAYKTDQGKEILNDQINEANKLNSYLESLVTTTQVIIGDQITQVKNYDEQEKAIAKLTDEQRRLLQLRFVYITLSDDERDNIIKLRAENQRYYREALEGEASVSRRKNALLTEIQGNQKKAAELSESIFLAELDRQDALQKTVLETAAAFEKLIDELKDDAIDIDIVGPSMETYEIVQALAKQTSEGQRAEIQKQIDAMNEWRDTGVITATQFEEALAKLTEQYQQTYTWAEQHPLWAAIGIQNEQQLQQFQDYAGQIFDVIQDIVDQQVAASERLVDDLNSRIDEQEELVNREFELKKEGLGNNYALEQENLVKMQQARDQAIKDREKNIRIQRTLSTIEASISLITAAANIMKGFSSIPVVGVVLGILAVGAMIAAFVAAQSKVKDATQFAKGGRLKGLRHSEGGIPIPGTGIEVEGDEFVTNRRSTAKYLPLLEAINKDDRAGMKLFFDRRFINKIPGTVGMQFDIDRSQRLGEIVRELKRGKAEIVYGDGFVIERIGGYTKRINLN